MSGERSSTTLALVRAIRASISIPLIFAPFPGGRAACRRRRSGDNLPINVARALGADYVIASDLNVHQRGQNQAETLSGVVDPLAFPDSAQRIRPA